jgi:hypothetical protein
MQDMTKNNFRTIQLISHVRLSSHVRLFRTLVLLLKSIRMLISPIFVMRPFYLEYWLALISIGPPLFSCSNLTIKTRLSRELAWDRAHF